MIALSTDALWHESTARADIPDWVRNATSRLDKTLFAPMTMTLDVLKLTPYRAGYAMGMLQWSVKRMNTPLPKSPVPAIKKARLSSRAKRQIGKLFEAFLLEGGLITRAEFRQSKFIPSEAAKYVTKLEGRPLNELSEFHRGMAVGLHGMGPGSVEDKSNLATEILFFVAMFWRLVVRLKNVRELHAWLTRMLGASKVGDRKRVEKICQRIGLHFGQRGRPRIIPTVTLPC